MEDKHGNKQTKKKTDSKKETVMNLVTINLAESVTTWDVSGLKTVENRNCKRDCKKA